MKRPFAKDVLTKEVLQKVYVEESKSLAKIAAQFGYTVRTVFNLLHKHEIPPRPFTEKGRVSRKGFHHSEETKLKLSKAHTGKKLSPEHRAKVIQSLSYGLKGDENQSWKGGKTKTPEGYVLVLMPGHPFARTNNYILEHRLVMEKHLGRFLEPHEDVHHRNEVKDDNRIENLEILFNSDHLRLHWDEERRNEHAKKISEARANKYWSSYKKS